MSKRTGIVDDPIWRTDRARRAGLASAVRRRAERVARIEAYPDKLTAYEAGLKAGRKQFYTALAALKARDEA